MNMGTINGGGASTGGKTPSSWLSGGVGHHGRGRDKIYNIIPWTAPGRLAYSPPYLTCDQINGDELHLQREKKEYKHLCY